VKVKQWSIACRTSSELDFSQNRAEHDDILGDAYEYLMRHFATQSGKSKGQFYTPAEVSRVIAKVIGISPENAKASTTAYDPTCGSGSLLLKVAPQAGKHITLEGQEKDGTTAGLARMNMILHDFPTANILAGNTLAAPKFKDGEQLRTYDYVVANPPFSDKTWSTGLIPAKDPYQRFAWGEPPAKQGDYAYLLHISARRRAPARPPVFCPMACSSVAMPRPRSASSWSAPAHKGRQQEPPARARHPQDRGHLCQADRHPTLRSHGAAGRDRRPQEQFQPEPAALHR
jgi:N-6 DNA Methylase